MSVNPEHAAEKKQGPNRATTFNQYEKEKNLPVATGVLDYFPDAILAVSDVSFAGNEQHNPGEPLHWAREKSGNEADSMMRHFVRRGQRDGDGRRHSAKVAWRALAILQKEIEEDRDKFPKPGQLLVGQGKPYNPNR